MKLTQTTAVLGVLVAGALAACSDVNGPRTPTQLNEHSLLDTAGHDSYIVVFTAGVRDPRAMAAQLIRQHGGTLGFVYERALRGFSARLSEAAVAALRANPNVRLVEQDRVVTADTTQTLCQLCLGTDGRWGLEVLDQHTVPAIGTWRYSWFHNGSTVRAYIVDTGLDSTQSDFTGRGKNVFDAFGGSGQDCEGHGTHVAGIIGSRTWGVAKGVTLRGVRVLDCNGNGTDATVIAGLDFVIADHQNQGGALLPLTPAVANLSLGGPLSAALDSAVVNTIQAGVFVVVAAGNNNDNACNYSPSDVAQAVTVAAVQFSLLSVSRAGYSDFGSCVDLYGPGSNITSTRLGGGSTTMTGTSMATPFVTGTAAIYKHTFGDADQATIANWIVANATAGLIGGNPAGTPNLLVYKAPTL